MVYAIVLIIVGAALTWLGFYLMKPKDGNIALGGGAYVEGAPQERPKPVQEAGRILMGLGIILLVGGVVWILSYVLIALAWAALIVGVIALICFLFRTRW